MQGVFGGRAGGVKAGLIGPAALALFFQASGMVAAAPVTPPRSGVPARSDEPPITATGLEGDYLRAAHARIHRVWHDQYLPTISALDQATQASAAPAAVTLALEIRWDGSIASAEVVESSGDIAFDQAAIGVLKTAAPLPVAAHNLLSDDGYLHLVWTLARDARACATGGKLVRVDDPLEIALPKLLAAHRFDEVIRRVQTVPSSDLERATDQLARLWLSLPVASAQADIRAAAALARLGDRRQEARLRAGLAVPLTALDAARGLEALGVDVCAAVTPLIRSSVSAQVEAGFAVLAARAAQRPEVVPCATEVIGDATNGGVSPAVRARLVGWVARDRGPAWKNRYAAFMADKAPAVRAAALLASAKRGGGRPEMYRLFAYLHDPAVELRAAASAGLVRAAGDQALEQLYLLTREKDPRPYVWVSEELASYNTHATAEFLGKLLHHGGVAELPAARALASRQDPAARALIDPVLASLRADPKARPALEPLVAPPPAAATDRLPTAFRDLLVSRDTTKAASWLLSHLQATEPVEAVSLLCGWLDRKSIGSANGEPMASTVPDPSGP